MFARGFPFRRVQDLIHYTHFPGTSKEDNGPGRHAVLCAPAFVFDRKGDEPDLHPGPSRVHEHVL